MLSAPLTWRAAPRFSSLKRPLGPSHTVNDPVPSLFITSPPCARARGRVGGGACGFKARADRCGYLGMRP